MYPSVDVVLPRDGSIEALAAAQNLQPFGSLQTGFAAALSKALITSASIRGYPELVALGFWLRPANLRRTIDSFIQRQAGGVHLPRGLVFHVAPSNVDTIFVYSWFLSLLCGNRNVIRLSSRQGPQAGALLSVLDELLGSEEWRSIAGRTLVVRYGHDAATSGALSAACDMRVVWGGDATVDTFRAFPLRPHATELAFPDRFSLAVLQAEALATASSGELEQLASAFHNDVYWFGQMACSSPRMLVWVGGAAATQVAQQRFWPALQAELDRRGSAVAAADNMNKEINADALAVEQAGVRILTPDPRITRVELERPSLHVALHCGAGLFHETRIDGLEDLLPLLSRKIQTVSYHGIPQDLWRTFLETGLPAGIDRIVTLGAALDFEPVWDGQDLIAAFLRQVTIR